VNLPLVKSFLADLETLGSVRIIVNTGASVRAAVQRGGGGPRILL